MIHVLHKDFPPLGFVLDQMKNGPVMPPTAWFVFLSLLYPILGKLP